jgi:hypothetical protein
MPEGGTIKSAKVHVRDPNLEAAKKTGHLIEPRGLVAFPVQGDATGDADVQAAVDQLAG